MLETAFAGRWRRALFSCLISGLLFAGAGCSGSGTKTAAVTLVSITTTPSSPSVALGLTEQLSASGTYSDGSTKDLTASVSWSSSATNIATISTAGLASAVAQGTATITAASGDITGSTVLSVSGPVLVSIQIMPASPSLGKGAIQQLTAAGIFSDKSQSALTNATWTSSSTTVATVSASGLVDALTVGTSTVAASVGSISASTLVTVVPPQLVSIAISPSGPQVAAGLTQQFTASGTYSDGSTGTPGGLTWATSDIDLASIDADGLVTSYHQGSVTVTATSGSIQGRTQLSIEAPVLTGLSVSPASASLNLGATAPQAFTATGSYSDQSTSDVTSEVAWTVSNIYVATIATSGEASPLRSGFTQVTATLNAVSGNASLTVLSNPRFLYEATDSGRDLSRLLVNAANGQLRHWGYQSTQIRTNAAPGCISTDPTNQYVYVTNVVTAGGSAYTGTISAYSVDPVNGNLTSLGAPQTIPDAIGCIQFEPSGNFAYAVPGVDEATQQIVTLQKASSGLLSVIGTLPMPDYVSSMAIDPLGRFLYIGTQQLVANGLASAYGYLIDASSGALTPINGTPFSLPTNTGAAFSFSPSGDYLYLSDMNGTSITGYSVNRSTGVVTTGATSVNPCINPSALQFTPDGSLAFASCGESINRSIISNNLISFTVGANGDLTQAGVSSAYLSPTSVTVDPSGKYLYLISSGANYFQNGAGSYSGGYNSVVTYSINSDGTTTELDETAGRVGEDNLILLGGVSPAKVSTQWLFFSETFPGTPLDPQASQIEDDRLQNGLLFAHESLGSISLPFSLTTLPWHSDLLVAAPQTAPNLQALSVTDSAGDMSIGTSFGDGTTPGAVIMDPSGVVAFSSEPSTGNIYWFANQGTPGQWTDLQSAPGVPASFSAEAGAGPLAMDPAGRYLFVANQTANSISEFQYAGAASKAAYPLPASPIAITTDPSGNLLFVIGKDNMLRMLRLNVNGDLTDIADASLAGTPTAVTVEPSGHFIYVASSTGIDAFAINRTAGTLTPITLTLPPLLTGCYGIYAEPSGTYLYVLATDPSFYYESGLFSLTIQGDGTLSGSDTMAATPEANVTAISFWSTVQ